MRWLALLGLLTTGCGGAPDCCEAADAAIDMRPDATLSTYHYVLDRIHVPTTNTKAREYGLDLSNDGTVDNQLGMVLSTLAAMGIPATTATTGAVDRGDIIQLLSLATFDFTEAYEAHATVLLGSTPTPPACTGAGDTVCRQHLAGTASFTVSPTTVALSAGMFSAGTFRGGPGRFTLKLVLHDGGNVITLPLIGARTRLSSVTESAIATGVIAGAVPHSVVMGTVVPEMRSSFMVAVVRDCTDLTNPPVCGCGNDTSGKTMLGLFDTAPKDCSISVSEVQNNSLIVSLLAPDVFVDGQNALSIGVGASAVRATFSYP